MSGFVHSFVATDVSKSQLMILNEAISNCVRPCRVCYACWRLMVAIHIGSFINLVNDVLNHQKTVWMMLSHKHHSIIHGHSRGTALNIFVVVEINPVRDIVLESHFHIHVNSSIMPQSHPLKQVFLVCV